MDCCNAFKYRGDGMESISWLQQLYYWVGEKLGYIDRNGCYTFEGLNTNGIAVHKRMGFKYKCTPHFVKDC